MENGGLYDFEIYQEEDSKHVYLKEGTICVSCPESDSIAIIDTNPLCMGLTAPARVERVIRFNYNKNCDRASFKMQNQMIDILEGIEIPKLMISQIKSVQFSMAGPTDTGNSKKHTWKLIREWSREDLVNDNVVRPFGKDYAMGKLLQPYNIFSFFIEFEKTVNWKTDAVLFRGYEVLLPLNAVHTIYGLRNKNADHSNPEIMKIQIV